MSSASSNAGTSKERKYSSDDEATAASGDSTSQILDYPMRFPKRGKALIISNVKFPRSTDGRDRNMLGHGKDASDLERIFERLGFSVCIESDATKGEIIKLAEDYAKKDHSNYDCFIMVVLSHGGDGTVCGIDKNDNQVNIKNQIVANFEPQKCPSLASKPKIFMFQACRRLERDEGVNAASNLPSTNQQKTNACNEGTSLTIPSAANFLFCYATTPGFVSYHQASGSWYIQELQNVVNKLVLSNGCEPLDFLQVLTIVNRNVSERRVDIAVDPDDLRKKQMPCFLSTLTRNLFLLPKPVEASSEQQDRAANIAERRKAAKKKKKRHKKKEKSSYKGRRAFKNIKNTGEGAAFGASSGGDHNVSSHVKDDRRSKRVMIEETKGDGNVPDGDVNYEPSKRSRRERSRESSSSSS